MNSKTFFRQLKSTFSGTGRTIEKEKDSGNFIFKRTNVKKEKPAERSTVKLGSNWNSRTFFVSITIFAVIIYSVAQLAIGVYLDDLSKQLQGLREEENYLVEENKNIDSKIAKHKSKIRVEIAATDELQMKKSSEKDIVRIIDGTVSAGLLH